MVTLSFAETTFFRLYDISLPINGTTSLDGFEPSTFRLTADRANRIAPQRLFSRNVYIYEYLKSKKLTTK